jgi:hypothetical protein
MVRSDHADHCLSTAKHHGGRKIAAESRAALSDL